MLTEQHEQYLFSDLTQSTISPPASLIPPNAHKTLLFSRPTLLQITSITEIGSSAFQLQNVAEQRKDILSGQTRIRRMDDESEDDEDDEASKGKLPAYPRGMLKFELSVGDGRVIKAVEYRRMEGIKLGETGLGAKLLVQNVKVLRGTRERISSGSSTDRESRLMDQSCLSRPTPISWVCWSTTSKLSNQPAFSLD